MGTDGRGSKAPGKPQRPKVEPISKSGLAARKGVTRSAVTKACLPGGPLAAAQLETGRIDLSHPAAQAWLASVGHASGVVLGDDGLPEGDAELENIEGLGELTINQVVERYGSKRGFIDYVDALKKIAEIRRLDLKNAEVEGSLISRELVRTHVFGALDAVNRRLLSDTVKTIAQRARTMALANEPVEAIEKVAGELVTATLGPAKTQAAKALRERR